MVIARVAMVLHWPRHCLLHGWLFCHLVWEGGGMKLESVGPGFTDKAV